MCILFVICHIYFYELSTAFGVYCLQRDAAFEVVYLCIFVGRFDSCRELFKKLQILPFQSQYIFSLLLFVIKNKNYFIFNTEIHNINTRYNYNLHLPSTNLSIVQKGVLFSGSKIYNHLSLDIKLLSGDVKKFKASLR
jgi:hypothetical protein